MNKIRSAIWSGLIATGPMSIALFAIQKRLKAGEKSPLPPATLTQQLIGSSNPNITMLVHFAYGVGAALVFSALPPPKKTVLIGGTFGMAVWALSYLGWAPLFGMRARAPNMPITRNTMMIAAHLIWGMALGSSYENLREEGNQMLTGNRKAVLAE